MPVPAYLQFQVQCRVSQAAIPVLFTIYIHVQWNPSIPATLGTEIIGLIIEVATFQGLIYTQLGQRACGCYREVATIQRLGIGLGRFHCTCKFQ